jgi:hypothetical protein
MIRDNFTTYCFPYLKQFVIHCHPVVWCFVIWALWNKFLVW